MANNTAAPNRIRFTFELTSEMLELLTERAAREERTTSGQIRHYLNLALGLSDESEPPRDTTPSLPGMP